MQKRPAILICFSLFVAATTAAKAQDASSISMDSPQAAHGLGHRSHRHVGSGRIARHQGRHRTHVASGGIRGGWAAIAVSLQDGGVSSGFSKHNRSPADAIAQAIQLCSNTGRSGCYAPIAAFKGCGYVSISVDGSEKSAWGTGGTPSDAIAQCESNGVSCTQPIGGCN
jgi:hypothetical protein